MYTDRVRSYIAKLNDYEKAVFLSTLHSVLREKGRSVKRKDLNRTLEAFLTGVPPRIDYFEAYLEALDAIGVDGALHVLAGKQKRIEDRDWSDLMRRVTNGELIDEDARIYLGNESVVYEVNILIQNTINFCASQSLKKFLQNLHDFNRFLLIKVLESEQN